MSTKKYNVDWSKLPLGKVSDTDIAKQIGCTPSLVYLNRMQRGIPRQWPAWKKPKRGEKKSQKQQPATAHPDMYKSPAVQAAFLLFEEKGLAKNGRALPEHKELVDEVVAAINATKEVSFSRLPNMIQQAKEHIKKRKQRLAELQRIEAQREKREQQRLAELQREREQQRLAVQFATPATPATPEVKARLSDEAEATLSTLITVVADLASKTEEAVRQHTKDQKAAMEMLLETMGKLQVIMGSIDRQVASFSENLELVSKRVNLIGDRTKVIESYMERATRQEGNSNV